MTDRRHGRKLKQYRGRLTPGQIAEGMNAAIRTARQLAEDARQLFDNGMAASRQPHRLRF